MHETCLIIIHDMTWLEGGNFDVSPDEGPRGPLRDAGDQHRYIPAAPLVPVD